MTTFTTWIIPIAWGENKIKKEPLRIFKWKLQYPNNLWPTDINKSVAYMYYYTLNINVLFLLYLRGDVSQEKTFLSLIELKKYIENGHIERKWSSQLTDFIIKLGSCFYERKMEKKTYEWLVPYAKAEPTGSCPKSDAINSPFLSFFFFFSETGPGIASTSDLKSHARNRVSIWARRMRLLATAHQLLRREPLPWSKLEFVGVPTKN